MSDISQPISDQVKSEISAIVERQGGTLPNSYAVSEEIFRALWKEVSGSDDVSCHPHLLIMNVPVIIKSEEPPK